MLQGLLGEVDVDEELLAAFTASPKQPSKAAGQQQQVHSVIAGNSTKAESVSTSRQPLTSRITAKESAALLELLETDEPEVPAVVAHCRDKTAAVLQEIHRCACNADYNAIPHVFLSVCSSSKKWQWACVKCTNEHLSTKMMLR
jgi:hypothetical protein